MFRLVNGGERLPQRATRFSAGFDVFANEDVEIGAGGTKLIGLGIALDESAIFKTLYSQYGLPTPENADQASVYAKLEYEHFLKSHYFDLCIRSSLALKGLIIPNGAGKIDMDYGDEIKMMIHNPIGMDTVDLAIRTFHIALDGALRKQSSDQIERTVKDYILENEEKAGIFRINRGDKIGQLILCRHEGYLLPAEYTLDAERNGGFGSTGNA